MKRNKIPTVIPVKAPMSTEEYFSLSKRFNFSLIFSPF